MEPAALADAPPHDDTVSVEESTMVDSMFDLLELSQSIFVSETAADRADNGHESLANARLASSRFDVFA